MTVKDLADRLEVKAKDILKKMIERRVMMTINTTLDTETATMIAREFGADVKMRSFEEEMVVIAAAESPSIEPKFPCPSTNSYRIENFCAILTSAS